jgi:hypothetical protein
MTMLDDLSFPFNNSFADEMEGFFVPWQGDKVPDPQIVVLNIALAAELGLDPTVLNSAAGAAGTRRGIAFGHGLCGPSVRRFLGATGRWPRDPVG